MTVVGGFPAASSSAMSEQSLGNQVWKSFYLSITYGWGVHNGPLAVPGRVEEPIDSCRTAAARYPSPGG